MNMRRKTKFHACIACTDFNTLNIHNAHTNTEKERERVRGWVCNESCIGDWCIEFSGY